METLSIPHFQLSNDEQKELVNHIVSTRDSLETYYSPYYENVRRARTARDLKNYEKDLLPILLTENDTLESRPNVCGPWVKATLNSITSEVTQALFTQDFLTFDPVDPRDADSIEDLTGAFNAVREETLTDNKEEDIVDYCTCDGTVPIVIQNDGRLNSVHEIVPTYEVTISEEVRQVINQYFQQDSLNYIGEPLATNIDFDPGTKVIFKEETIENEGEEFKGVVLKSESGLELQRFADDEESGEKALNLAFNFLQQLGVDARAIKIINQEVVTTDKWIEGYPRPVILDILRTYIVPPDEDDNPDTYKFISADYKKTQLLIDNPNYINKDKLLVDGKPIGSKEISQSKNDYKKVTLSNNYKASEAVVKINQMYLDHFKFKSKKELRNFIVTIVEDKHLIECRPNIFYTETAIGKISKSPLIVTTFNKMMGENIGSTPIHDILDLAKTANILINYGLDELSRNGNHHVFFSNLVDIKTQNGGTATFAEIDGEEARLAGINDVRKAYAKIESSNSEAMNAFNTLGVIKEQIHSVANAAPMPFMQSNPQDTATQAMVLSQQANAIIAKIVKHIARSLQTIYIRMLEDLINRGIKVDSVPYYDNQDKKTYFKSFDFGELKGRKFIPRLTSLTPNLNKQIKMSLLEKVITILLQNQDPKLHARVDLSELIQEFFKQSEIDSPNIVRGDAETQEELLKIDEKEALYNAIKSGQFTIVPVQQSNGTGDIQQPNSMGNPESVAG